MRSIFHKIFDSVFDKRCFMFFLSCYIVVLIILYIMKNENLTIKKMLYAFIKLLIIGWNN